MDRPSLVIPLGALATIISLVAMILYSPWMPGVVVKPKRANPCAPIIISVGGTYSGCYESTNSAVPAVEITTTAAVTISRATIRHKGLGVLGDAVRVNLVMRDDTVTALQPATPVLQEGVKLFQPSSVIVENNRFVNGHGVLANGNNLSTSPYRVARNDFIDIGRWDQPACCIGAVHTDKLLAPGGNISWNRINNTYGQSVSEDVIGIYQSNGSSGNPLTIDHNLVNGDYPYTGNGSSFTGAGIDIGDSGGTWLVGDSNTVVNAANSGIIVGAGGDQLIHTNSVAVSDGKAGINDSGPTVSSTFGGGIVSYGVADNVTITNNQAGWRRWNGTSFESQDYLIPEADVVSGNTNISPVNAAAEQAALDAWEASRVAAGVFIGPR